MPLLTTTACGVISPGTYKEAEELCKENGGVKCLEGSGGEQSGAKRSEPTYDRQVGWIGSEAKRSEPMKITDDKGEPSAPSTPAFDEESFREFLDVALAAEIDVDRIVHQAKIAAGIESLPPKPAIGQIWKSAVDDDLYLTMQYGNHGTFYAVQIYGTDGNFQAGMCGMKASVSEVVTSSSIYVGTFSEVFGEPDPELLRKADETRLGCTKSRAATSRRATAKERLP